MNGKPIPGNAPIPTPSILENSGDTAGRRSGANAEGMRKAKIVLRLPDGRVITVSRDLPKLPLGI